MVCVGHCFCTCTTTTETLKFSIVYVYQSLHFLLQKNNWITSSFDGFGDFGNSQGKTEKTGHVKPRKRLREDIKTGGSYDDEPGRYGKLEAKSEDLWVDKHEPKNQVHHFWGLCLLLPAGINLVEYTFMIS